MNELTDLANMYKTDKGTVMVYPLQAPHNFTAIYHEYFKNRRDSINKVLEIGIYNGASLRMWRDYFRFAHIYGIDFNPQFMFSEYRITTFLAIETDERKMNLFFDMYGSDFDLIIDDGSHITTEQQSTFGFLFRHVKSGGIYIVEDLQTSLMDQWMKPLGFDKDYAFSAYNVLRRLQQTGNLDTPYIKENDKKYILDHIKNINVFTNKTDQEWHITAVIEKK